MLLHTLKKPGQLIVERALGDGRGELCSIELAPYSRVEASILLVQTDVCDCVFHGRGPGIRAVLRQGQPRVDGSSVLVCTDSMA